MALQCTTKVNNKQTCQFLIFLCVEVRILRISSWRETKPPNAGNTSVIAVLVGISVKMATLAIFLALLTASATCSFENNTLPCPLPSSATLLPYSARSMATCSSTAANSEVSNVLTPYSLSEYVTVNDSNDRVATAKL